MNDTNSEDNGVPKDFSDELKANFNSLLYLLTETMALNISTVQMLAKKGIIDEEEFKKVFSVTGDKEALTNVYNELFGRFVGYYGKVREMIADGSYQAMSPVASTEKVSTESVVQSTVSEKV